MPATTNADKVYMEFLGPVPGVLGPIDGYHAVFWVQAAGGAGFTRPSLDERNFYAEQGKPVPEWQCEYFDFDGLTWTEPAVTGGLWRGAGKLRSLFVSPRGGRTEAEFVTELPELERFIRRHGLQPANLKASFQEALLHAAEKEGVIQRGVMDAAPRPSDASQVILYEDSWW